MPSLHGRKAPNKLKFPVPPNREGCLEPMLCLDITGTAIQAMLMFLSNNTHRTLKQPLLVLRFKQSSLVLAFRVSICRILSMTVLHCGSCRGSLGFSPVPVYCGFFRGQWAVVLTQQGPVRAEVLLLWLSPKTLFLSSSSLMGSLC